MPKPPSSRIATAALAASLLVLPGLGGGTPARAATPVSVFPAPGTPVASDETTFSFRGLRPGNLGRVRVVGSRSGPMDTTRLRHSDGRGVSLVPEGRFTPGENVRVYTDQRIRLARGGDFRVRIGRFYGNDRRRAGPQVPLSTSGLNSRPELDPPDLELLTRTDAVSPGKFLIAPRSDGLTIVDNRGRVVWFRPTSHGGKGEIVANLRRQTLDGKPVLTYWKASTDSREKFRLATFEILDDRYRRIARFTPGNGNKADLHELEITPRGTALILAVRGVRWDATRQGGSARTKVLDDIVQEIDLKTGAVLFEWHSLGNVGLATSAEAIPTDGRPYDYFHANSIADDGNSILLSARRQSTIYRIDRKTARIKWRLRGDRTKSWSNDFRMGQGTSFGYQHDARRLENGDISIFDNGSQSRDDVQSTLPTVNPQSGAMVLDLGFDEGERTATLVERVEHPEGLVSDSQGGAEKQANGNFVAGWGSLPRFTEFTPQGEIAFDMSFGETESNSYRAFKSKWRGLPAGRPALASGRTGEESTVWASWNGATGLRRWKVFTGPGRNSLAEVGSSPWKNLETAIPVPALDRMVQVAAIDGGGREIARSRVVKRGGRSHPIATSALGRAALEASLLRRPFHSYR